jgi:hypothetical protein
MTTTGTKPIETEPISVSGPRDFFIAPVFAAHKQETLRSVVVGHKRYEIGGFHPLDPKQQFYPGLDMRHLRGMLSLLSFRNPSESASRIPFSMNELCRRYAHSNGGRYSKHIKSILWDLRNTPFHIHDETNGECRTYWILKDIVTLTKPIRRKDDSRAHSNQRELWIERAELTPEFVELLSHIAELAFIRLDVLVGMQSQIAQAIYTYIPSRAHHHSETNPFEISVTNLLNQISHPVPKEKWLRKQLFTQNKNSIISQLDGKETNSGVFRFRLTETADRKDWKVQCWVVKAVKDAPKPKAKRDSKMIQAFLASGRAGEELERRLSSVEPLTTYEMELLARAKVAVEGSEKAFELAKALLGSTKFEALLSEAKGDAIEGRPTTKTPNHRLMSRIMEALRAP